MTQHLLLIQNAHVLDIHSGHYTEQDVLSVDGVIRECAPRLTPAGDDTQVVDARGGYLIPGLIDGHVHTTADSAALGTNNATFASLVAAQASKIMRGMLSRGFTTVRDMGGADMGLAQAQIQGLFPGPAIHFAGRALSQTGGHADFREPGNDNEELCRHGIGRVVDGVDNLRRAAREEIRKGAHHLKIMASGGTASPTDRIDSTQYSEDEIRAVVQEARAANRYVAAHAYTAGAINRALKCGVRSIEHGNLLDQESLDLLTSSRAFLVPTLVTYWALKREGREHGQSQRSWEKVDAVLGAGLAALEAAHRAGVDIVFGSDLLGGMHRHQNREFQIRAEVQPPLAVLQGATSVAARLLDREGTLGELSVGAAADMILTVKDPLTDASVLAEPERHFTAVIQAGRVVS